MKLVDLVKALGAVVCVTIACNAYSQASDTGTGGDMGASAPMSKKAMRRADRQLDKVVLKAISKALPGVDVTTVFVHARGGDVTLSGSVPEQSQIEVAGQAAKNVQGVKSVSNKLTVLSRSDSGG
jgi:hyperosmotically inducible protein